MASSGTTIWQLSRDEIINAALRKIGVLGEGVSANATQITDGTQALNALILEYQSVHGMSLWVRRELDLTLVAGQGDYTIGIGQIDYDTAYPIKLLQANLNIPNSSSNLNLIIMADYDFNNLPNTSTGTPVNVMYEPRVNYGIFSVWPVPDSSVTTGTTITLTYQKPYDVFTSAIDTADFPQEWTQALIYGLAYSLSDEYSLPLSDRQWFEKQADKHRDAAMMLGAEDSSMFFQPNKQG